MAVGIGSTAALIAGAFALAQVQNRYATLRASIEVERVVEAVSIG